MPLRSVFAGLVLEIRPLPMAAALLTALLGLAWARGGLLPLPPAAPYLIGCVFFGLYTAHLMDTFVDVVKRGDRTPADYPLVFRDSTGLIDDRRYPPLIAASASLCAALAVPPVLSGGLATALLLGLGLALALLYAPLLDRTLLGVSLGYPTGVVAVLGAAHLTVGGAFDLSFAALATALFLALAGTKVRSDIIDLEEDRRISKCTVPVVLGPRKALAVGYALGLGGLSIAALLPVAFPVPILFAAPAVAAALVVAASARFEPFRASTAMAGALFALLVCEVAIVGFGASTALP